MMENIKTKKNVVYTVITKGYEYLLDPLVISNDFDYICFTDDDSFKSDIWQIRPLPNDVVNLDNTRKNRKIKLLPHRYLDEYDWSIYIDGNYRIKTDVSLWIEPLIDSNLTFFAMQHDRLRNCTYKEAHMCILYKKDLTEVIMKQMKKYRSEGFPDEQGLTGNSLIIRKHNDINLIKVNEVWWNELKSHSRRDQLSFIYSCWKEGFKYGILPGNSRENNYYEYGDHKKQ